MIHHTQSSQAAATHTPVFYVSDGSRFAIYLASGETISHGICDAGHESFALWATHSTLRALGHTTQLTEIRCSPWKAPGEGEGKKLVRNLTGSAWDPAAAAETLQALLALAPGPGGWQRNRSQENTIECTAGQGVTVLREDPEAYALLPERPAQQVPESRRRDAAGSSQDGEHQEDLPC